MLHDDLNPPRLHAYVYVNALLLSQACEAGAKSQYPLEFEVLCLSSMYDAASSPMIQNLHAI